MKILEDFAHNVLAHPFKERAIYEVHNINAVLVGVSDQTLVERSRLSCGEVGITLSFATSERTRHAINKEFNEITDEHLLIKREGDLIKPLGASIDDSKGSTRVDRLQDKISDMIKEYETKSGHKLKEVTVEYGKH